MPRIETTTKTVFQYSELSNSAKERAREWFTTGNDFDPDHVFEDAKAVADIIGIEFQQIAGRNMAGEPTSAPAIHYSGFCSQGDGASFTGWYYYRKGSKAAIREYAPTDKELHRITDSLMVLQRKAFYGFTATITQRGRYYHSGTMSVDVQHKDRDDLVTVAACEELETLMRDFADWIYKQLDQAHDHDNSDEVVAETIEANGYEFNEDGTFHG